MCRLNLLTSQKTRHGVCHGRGINILLVQIIQDLHMQRPVLPLVGFIKVDCYLDRHGVWHFTAPVPAPSQPARRPDTASYWTECCSPSKTIAPARSRPSSRRRNSKKL